MTVVDGSRNVVDVNPPRSGPQPETFKAILADPATRRPGKLVIAPCWSSADTPSALVAISGAVEAAGGTYVDPLTSGWFADPAGLVSPVDGICLLHAGHSYLAGLVSPLVDAARRS